MCHRATGGWPLAPDTWCLVVGWLAFACLTPTVADPGFDFLALTDCGFRLHSGRLGTNVRCDLHMSCLFGETSLPASDSIR